MVFRQSFASVNAGKSVKLMNFSDTIDIGSHSQVQLLFPCSLNDLCCG